ncbi:MAG: DUF456 domain-containing protein [Leptospiraceae bacterium]|nr:DUF456 domain-containing protein [Leptospiraceae bacterium]MCK6381021.1 DUF456 domain-containing protein [Leptospiraceae bacterium]NUM40921.1 DUF456 domain-containing protein [Leptospiraceae bacterium]
MDIFLIIVSGLLIFVGIFGSFLPVLPGPSIAWAGLFIATFTNYIQFSNNFLIITAIVTLLLSIFDYILPSLAVKNKGGTKFGERGALIGAIVGIFFGQWGIILGPFLGALMGELIANKEDFQNAFKIAFYSFIGFLLSTGLKLIWCLIIAFWFINNLQFS